MATTAEESTPSSNPSRDAALVNGTSASENQLVQLHTPSNSTTPFTPASTSATTGPPKPQVDAQGRTPNPRSCVTCRRRRVKCDKLHPCSHCKRAHMECLYPAPGRAPRRPKKAGDGRDKELLERLRRLEGVVKGLGVDVPELAEGQQAGKEADGGTGEPAGARDRSGDGVECQTEGVSNGTERRRQSAANKASLSNDGDTAEKARWVDEEQAGHMQNRFGRLVIDDGKSRYINNSFWANLSNEVEDLKGILNQPSDDEEGGLSAPTSSTYIPSTQHGWVFGFSSQTVDLLSLHPLPGQIELYWQTYKANVDPLVKVLHIPTIEPTILSAASHLGHLSKGFEALLFAVYYGATTSLSPEDCLINFGEEKQVLISRYRFAIEQALARANFLTTEELVVLQAFVIYLICLRRNSDARVIWTLTGLVVRIAQTIGVHRDGVHFGLAPFAIEMRRRLWWQVCILDIRASEDHGCDPTIVEQTFDTKMPLNINDVDISPHMKDFPPERQGCTDMSFCLIRFEVSNTFRRINYTPPRSYGQDSASVTLQDKERWITECHQRLEDRYLKHCDMAIPLFWVTATVARLMMSKMWLMVYHPFQRQDGGASLPAETKDKLFITSLENIEYSLLLETEARTMKWGWLFKTYMQWHAMAFMLSELCHRTTGDLVERAWIAVGKTRDGRWGEHIIPDTRAGHLWRPLKKLYRKAKAARAWGVQEEQLAKQRASGVVPVRKYSPNANPMFGHPKRPTMVRAPLSNAQLQRFTQGPAFGQRPLDTHELLKSPKLSQTVGVDDPMDAASLPSQTLGGYVDESVLESAMGSSYGFNQASGTPSAQQIYAPTAARADFQREDRQGNFLPNQPNDDNPQISTSATSLNAPARMDSTDSSLFDSSAMDISGEVNWENWDELVRQFGMDIDGEAGTPSWDGSGGAANLRMGMATGPGGDWF